MSPPDAGMLNALLWGSEDLGQYERWERIYYNSCLFCYPLLFFLPPSDKDFDGQKTSGTGIGNVNFFY